MSPLVQLNLAALDLGFLGRFPPVLFQVWGDGTGCFGRTIDLADIDGAAPDPERPTLPDDALMCFEHADPDVIGMRLEPDPATLMFTMPELRNMVDEAMWRELRDEFGHPLFSDPDFSRAEELYSDLLDAHWPETDPPGSGDTDPENLAGIWTSRKLTFGGQMEEIQVSYETFAAQGWRKLYSPKELSILGDGRLTILFRKYDNGRTEFMCYATR